MANKAKLSPLLKLPAEIRLRIYSYVFIGVDMARKKRATRSQIFSSEAITQRKPENDQAAPKLPPAPGLLFSCKALYTDALPHSYATSTFHFDADADNVRWKHTIPRRSLEPVPAVVYHARAPSRRIYTETLPGPSAARTRVRWLGSYGALATVDDTRRIFAQ